MNPHMSREDKVRMKEGKVENISGGEDIEMTVEQRKRKPYRHSSQQIRAMEIFFRDCPQPDKRKRNELSQELGMEPLQVKFWFQNKRTQMKSKQQLEENVRLIVESKKLRAVNASYREALCNGRCPTCGHVVGDVFFEERRLKMENAKLREEIERISDAAANYIGKPFNHRSTALGSGQDNGSGKDEEF